MANYIDGTSMDNAWHNINDKPTGYPGVFTSKINDQPADSPSVFISTLFKRDKQWYEVLSGDDNTWIRKVVAK